MDVSLVDLSMRDNEPKVKNPDNKLAPVARKAPADRTRSKIKAVATAKRRATQKRVVEVVIS
jgi:hypothetical protein